MTCCGYSSACWPYVSFSHTHNDTQDRCLTHKHTRTHTRINLHTILKAVTLLLSCHIYSTPAPPSPTQTHTHTWPGPRSPFLRWTHSHTLTIPSPWRVWQRLMMAYYLMSNWALHSLTCTPLPPPHTYTQRERESLVPLMHINCTFTQRHRWIYNMNIIYYISNIPNNLVNSIGIAKCSETSSS